MTSKISLLFIFIFSGIVSFAQNRGDLESANNIRTYTISQLRTELDNLGIPAALVPLEYGVEVVSLIYKTPDANGNGLVSASGIIAYPVGYPCDAALINYNHGTKVYDIDAMATLPGEALIMATLAANGYVVTGPDYLGLGASPGFHPYIHANSEASASVDMIRAGRLFCNTAQVGLNGQVFLTGYSQGGHAAMATQREIETNHSSEIQLTGTAPSGGVYNISGNVADFMLAQQPHPNPYYAAFIVEGWQSVYGNLYNTLDEVLVAPYDSLVPIMLNRLNHNQSFLLAQLPDTIIRMFQPAYIQAALGDSLHPFNVAARDNDVHDWVPQTPTRLYHCAADQDNTPLDSRQTVAHMRSLGAPDIAFIDPFPLANHSDCAPFAMLAAKAFFDSLRLDCNVGIEDLQAPSSKIEVFPHPVSGVSTVDFSAIPGSVSRIRLFDIDGKVVETFDGPFFEKIITLIKGNKTKGLYILSFEGKRIFREQIILGSD